MPEQNDREATERVVLKQLHAGGEPIPDGAEVYLVVGRAKNASKQTAIKQVAKDNPGKYRAPSLRAWKGGLEIVLPEKPKPESRLFE